MNRRLGKANVQWERWPGGILIRLLVRIALCVAVGIGCLEASAAGASQIEAMPVTGSAKLAKPIFWGSPDQPYGKRRAPTEADRAAIQYYRSEKVAPIFATNFADQAELAREWDFVSDDNTWNTWRSCRRPGNAVASSAGLRLETLVATDCHNRWSTAFVVSKARYGYGFFEARMKIADIKGMNNAFWMTTDDYPATGDHFEIDVTEAQYPSYDHIGLQQYPTKGNKALAHTGIGWGANFVDDLSTGFHDYGVLWRPNDMIYEVDGEPVAVAVTNGSVHPPAVVMLSTALIYAGVPEHPEGHHVLVRWVRVFAYQN